MAATDNSIVSIINERIFDMIRSCSLSDVSITEGFWRNRMDVNRKNTLPIEHEQCEKGDKVELDLDMPVERIEAHPSSWHNCGHVALQRGPIVYCLEEVDNGKDLDDIILPRNSQLSAVKEPLFGGIVTIAGKALRRDRSSWSKKLYSNDKSPLKPCSIKAIVFHLNKFTL